MAHVTAGKTVVLAINGHHLRVKIEDGSKSESISAKVEASDSPEYRVGQVYEFDRKYVKL